MSNEVELPELFVTEEDQEAASKIASCCLEHAEDVENRMCRERQLREALAQIAKLEDEAEMLEELSRDKLPCGHHYGYAFTDNGGKTGYCTLCHIASLAAQVEELTNQSGWKCFHCDFFTTDRKEASLHFGEHWDAKPICLDEGAARQMLALRQLSARSERLESENDRLREKQSAWVDQVTKALDLTNANLKLREKAEAELAALREGATANLFSCGERVIVDNPRYRGKGIVRYDTGKRGRMVGVLLGNGNTWEYEFETVTRERILDAGKGEG